MSGKEKTAASRDPKAGCVIALMIIGVVGFLISFSLITPFRQAKLMKEFTQPTPVEISTAEKVSAPLDSLTQKLSRTQDSMKQKAAGTLRLSVPELNHAIQHYEEFKDLRGKLQLEEITEAEMVFTISFPLRGAPFSGDTPHLNGTMYAVPEILNDEVVLMVSKIESRKGEVPEGFLNSLRPYRIMSVYTQHEHLGRAMFGMEEISLEPGALTLKLNPEKFNDQAAVTEEGEERRRKRSSMMTIFSFFLVGALFLFLIKRRNAQSAKAMQEQSRREDL